MTLILAQNGGTNWGFQVGRAWFYVNKPEFWKTCGFFGGHGIGSWEDASERRKRKDERRRKRCLT